MIILMDGGVWQKLVDFFDNGIPRTGTIVINRHLIDEPLLHWVYSIGNPKILLGRAEVGKPIHTKISKIEEKHLEMIGFGSREFLKRSFANALNNQDLHDFIPMPREIDNISVAEFKIVSIERYWCLNPKCYSTNLFLQQRRIYLQQLPFICLDCGKEFIVEDIKGFPWIRIANRSKKITELTKRYSKNDIQKRPKNQFSVIAIAGENWAIPSYNEHFQYFCVRCKRMRLSFVNFLNSKLLFVCNDCGEEFVFPDQESYFVANNARDLERRYPKGIWYRRELNRLNWWIRYPLRCWE